MASTGDWILKIISGPHQGVEEVLRPGRIVVGTAPDCDIVLHDVLVAPQHLALTLADGRLTVEALESRVYCQGRRVSGGAQVPPFSFVTAGTTQLVLGPVDARWPLLSAADAPELEKDPAPATTAEPAASAAAATPATVDPKSPAAPTAAQRKRAWWLVGLGGVLLLVWLVLWFLWRPQPVPEPRLEPKVRAEQVLRAFPQAAQVKVEERGERLVVSGYLESDALNRDLTAALGRDVPEATLRLWSTPRLVATARTFLAERKLPLTLTAGENGTLSVSGTVPSQAEWTRARQALLAEVPGLQQLQENITVAPAKSGARPAVATPPPAPVGEEWVVVSLQAAGAGPGWVRLANGHVLFPGGRLNGRIRCNDVRDGQALFSDDTRTYTVRVGENLAHALAGGAAPAGEKTVPQTGEKSAPAQPLR